MRIHTKFLLLFQHFWVILVSPKYCWKRSPVLAYVIGQRIASKGLVSRSVTCPAAAPGSNSQQQWQELSSLPAHLTNGDYCSHLLTQVQAGVKLHPVNSERKKKQYQERQWVRPPGNGPVAVFFSVLLMWPADHMFTPGLMPHTNRIQVSSEDSVHANYCRTKEDKHDEQEEDDDDGRRSKKKTEDNDDKRITNASHFCSVPLVWQIHSSSRYSSSRTCIMYPRVCLLLHRATIIAAVAAHELHGCWRKRK